MLVENLFHLKFYFLISIKSFLWLLNVDILITKKEKWHRSLLHRYTYLFFNIITHFDFWPKDHHIWTVRSTKKKTGEDKNEERERERKKEKK